MISFLIKLKVAIFSDQSTNTAAVMAIASPAWLPALQDISHYAALLLPIFGVVWLVVQTWSKIYRGK